ncbi:PREDICTED: trypsin-4-like [Nicrophorus vespilloides]|uniref:Trypsin-4-like n=1 Tax=Nicrophorus vespilloides TaxID=110193 RepID=A0ABM1M4I3_NICVS|nr:PREDICTED: trypsin-4-like [Nicrophorus vespilloides]
MCAIIFTLYLIFIASASGDLHLSRIVGGADADIKDYPYQLSLQFRGAHVCGAALISEFYALTAAHCTEGVSIEDLSVRVGSSTANSKGEVVNLSTYYQNEKYDTWIVDYDMSILKFVKPLVFRNTVRPIALPDLDEEVPEGKEAIGTGWGITVKGGSVSRVLQMVKVYVFNQEECQEAYGDAEITERMLCAGNRELEAGVCQGDSGGPLVIDDKLVGLVSWGKNCGERSHPGVYTRVARMRDFIMEKTGL